MPVSSSSPNSAADEQQRRRDPCRQPVRERPTDGEADESRRKSAQFGVFGRARPQVAQARGTTARSGWNRGSAAAAPRGWAPCASALSLLADATSGSSTTAEPMNIRTPASTQAPTGRAASNHELAATMTATPSSTSAIPSRRCPGSMWRACPIDRAARPVPLAAIIQAPRAVRPQVRPASTSSDRLRRLAGLFARLRARLRAFWAPAWDHPSGGGLPTSGACPRSGL